jgi:hypothetical protein
MTAEVLDLAAREVADAVEAMYAAQWNAKEAARGYAESVLTEGLDVDAVTEAWRESSNAHAAYVHALTHLRSATGRYSQIKGAR